MGSLRNVHSFALPHWLTPSTGRNSRTTRRTNICPGNNLFSFGRGTTLRTLFFQILRAFPLADTSRARNLRTMRSTKFCPRKSLLSIDRAIHFRHYFCRIPELFFNFKSYLTNIALWSDSDGYILIDDASCPWHPLPCPGSSRGGSYFVRSPFELARGIPRCLFHSRTTRSPRRTAGRGTLGLAEPTCLERSIRNLRAIVSRASRRVIFRAFRYTRR